MNRRERRKMEKKNKLLKIMKELRTNPDREVEVNGKKISYNSMIKKRKDLGKRMHESNLNLKNARIEEQRALREAEVVKRMQGDNKSHSEIQKRLTEMRLNYD